MSARRRASAARIEELVREWGADTLAPFALREDKSYFLAEDGGAFVAYRVVGGVAIVSGDPIGSPEAFGPLVERFLEHAHRCDWRVAILGASEGRLDLYRSHGLNALYHGDEAVVDTAAFALEGRAIRKVRQSVHRLEAAGYRVQVRRPSEIDAGWRAELESISAAWRDGQPERGFAMAFDALFAFGDEDAVFFVGVDPEGRPARVPPLRDRLRGRGSLALLDAARPGRDPERVQRVADLRGGLLGRVPTGSGRSRSTSRPSRRCSAGRRS